MGGSGSGSRFGPLSQSMIRKLQQAQDKERETLEKDINQFINKLLIGYNERDLDSRKKKLDEVREVLKDEAEIDQILFGGSVAKHTEVSGISDIDALVILDRSDLQGKSPKELLDAFSKILSNNLPRNDLKSLERGKLAVTIKYDDGTELQLLPALRTKKTISIATSDGKNWNETKPRVFQEELTTANSKMNNALIPSIKLFKSINSSLPEQKQLSGYHIETLSVDAVRNYNGPKTYKNILIHLLNHSSQRILTPIKDTTGQSRVVDEYLGKANSIQRKNISQALNGMKRRLESATSVSQWRAVFEDE